MPRKWTREERRAFLREKYYSRREKAFTVIICTIALLIVLHFATSGLISELPIQLVSASFVLIVIFLFFIFVYAEGEPRWLITILLIASVFLGIISLALVSDALSGAGQLIVSIVLGLVFLLLLFVAAFAIDLYAVEGV